MQKYILIFLTSLLFLTQVSAEQTEDISFNKVDWYALFEERVEKICTHYTTGTSYKPVINLEYEKNPEEYQIDDTFLAQFEDWLTWWIKIEDMKWESNSLNILSYIDTAKDTYSKSMNSIYKCWVLSIQKASLTTVKWLITTGSQKADIEGKIDSQIEKTEKSLTALKCTDPSSTLELKKNILAQTTYELCVYQSYLEYLREYSNYLDNYIKKDDSGKATSVSRITQLKEEAKTRIDKDIERAHKIFPIAYQAYSEYENNITIHTLLQLLKEDFIILRDRYHKTINPINQVVYKIANAMKK